MRIFDDYKGPFLNANIITIESWFTAEQVAHHLGVVKGTVYRWLERKGLPAHKNERLWKFQLSEVNEWFTPVADEDSERRNMLNTNPPKAGNA